MADPKKYISIFREEADEHLTSLGLGLLELEQRSDDKTLIHELLRNAHTLKGSAKMLGFNHIGEVAHKMEDIFKAVESGSLSISAGLIDVLLLGTDTIRDIVEKISTQDNPVIDVSDVVGALEKALSVTTPVEAKKEAETPLPAETEKPVPRKPRKRKKKVAEEKETEAPSASVEANAGPTVLAQDTASKVETRHLGSTTRETIRVDTWKLDDLLNLAGELLINKIKLESKLHQLRILLESFSELKTISENGGDPIEKSRRITGFVQSLHDSLDKIYQEMTEDVIELDLFSQEIRNNAFSLRVLPASTLFDEFHRTVRDFAKELGKEIQLKVTGGETELDKQLLEELKPALIHIIRNSCDHGIEPPDVREALGKPREGLIHINAYHKGHNVIIEITDDGRGVDVAKVKETAVKRGLVDERTAREMPDEDAIYFILQPGFTTAPIITDFSGRGVGMDVVKTNMERIKGDLTIETELGKYTKVTLIAPLTLSIINALLVKSNNDIYAIPLTFVEEAVRVPAQAVFSEAGKDVFNLRGTIVPLVRLSELLGTSNKGGELLPEKIPVVVLKFRNQKLGLIVQQFLRDQEIVVKSLGEFLSEAMFTSGATILRQGEPAIILNVFDIFTAAERLPSAGLREQWEKEKKEKGQVRILVVDDSITTRIMEKSILEAHGYQVDLAVSGEEAEDKLSKETYDLIVTDVEMPGINGFELTRRIRSSEKTAETPVIIVTSLASDEDKRKGIEVGAQAYIVKGSFDQTVLLNTVKSLVG